MLGRHPGAQLGQRRIRVCRHPRTQHIMQPAETGRDVITLQARRGITKVALTGAGLGHIRGADAKTCRQLADWCTAHCKHPIPQVLPIRLAKTPTHHRLRPLPETYESHHPPVPKEPIEVAPFAYSGGCDRLIRPMAITQSGDRDHLRMAAVGRCC